MAERNEIIAVYAADVVQGMALVTFPAQYPTHSADARRPLLRASIANVEITITTFPNFWTVD